MVAIGLSVLAFCMLSAFGGYTVYGRWKRIKQGMMLVHRLGLNFIISVMFNKIS